MKMDDEERNDMSGSNGGGGAEKGLQGVNRGGVDEVVDGDAVRQEKGLAESAMRSQEAQEGASGVKVESNGANDNKTREEAIKGAGGENGIGNDEETQRSGKLNGRGKNPQKKTFAGMIIALVVVLLVAAGLVVFVFWRTKELASEVGDQVSGDGGTGVVEEPEEKPAEPETPEVEELSLDDAAVRELYGKYSRTNGQVYLNEEVLAGKMPEWFMLILARLNAEPSVCKGVETNLEVYGEAFLDMWSDLDPNAKARTECYNGSEVLAKMEELFGKTMMLEDGMMSGSFTPGGQPQYKYDKELDEFWYYIVPGGGTGPIISNELYKAERSGNRVYLYDAVARMTQCIDGNGNSALAVGSLSDDLTRTGYNESLGWEISNLCNEPLVKGYADADDGIVEPGVIREHKDEFSQFKWTFTENDDGEYVFTGLEKVK